MIQRYQAQFAKQLVNQLIAIIQRDQQAALSVINAARPPGRPLNPFAAFFKEAAPIQNWPAMVLVARSTQFDQASDADLRTEAHTFFCAMAISGTDPEWLADDAMDYLRAVDIVLTSAPLGDFYLSLPSATGRCQAARPQGSTRRSRRSRTFASPGMTWARSWRAGEERWRAARKSNS